jgi:hypothetical protein
VNLIIKKLRNKLIYFTMFLFCNIVLTFYCGITAKANVTSSGADHPYGTFYNDGVYEYTMGTNFIMSNTYSDSRLWNSDPNYYGEITTTNLRDRSTALHNTDRRGWEYVTSEWFWYSEETKYSGVNGFNEYVGDNWVVGPLVQEGVQDGGPGAYTNDGVVYNRYRRAVIMIYRRPLPKPSHGSSWLAGYSGGVYASGSSLWIQPKQFTMYSEGADIRSDSDGQLAQYSENIIANYIFTISSDASIWLEAYTYAPNGNSWSSWYNGHSIGGQYLSGMSITGNRTYSNAIPWNTYYRNGLQSGMTLTLPDNKDMTWKFDHGDKYGTRLASYYTLFAYGGNAYSTLKTDGTAPSGNNVRVLNKTATGYDVYVDNVNDSRSGVKVVKFPTWTKANQSDLIWLNGTNMGSGTWKIHVDQASFGNAIANYTTHVYTYDNVGNEGMVSGVNVDLYLPNTAPTAAFTVTPIPQFKTGTLTYIDTSNANDVGDSISAREWSYSIDGGNTWSIATSTAPSSFANSGSYKIRLRVKDTGNLGYPALWSDYATQTVIIVQPIAFFTVSPNPQFSGAPLIYNDTSLTNITGNAISTREWSYSNDGGITWSTATSSAPTNFIVTTSTTYFIRERVKSTQIGPYISIWSDYCIRAVYINDMSVIGEVNHTLTWNQNRINFNISKTGTTDSPRTTNICCPGENFVITAKTTEGANAQSVNVKIEGTTFSTYLIQTASDTWTGELWDESMIDWDNQIIKFTFTATYPYGVIKTCDVYIEIDNDGGGYWKLRQSY